MRVTAQHAGQEPDPFEVTDLAEPARADWNTRTGKFGRDADAAEAQRQSTAASTATTEQLESRAVQADAERRRAAREVLRCAQAGLRTQWPMLQQRLSKQGSSQSRRQARASGASLRGSPPA